MSAPDFVMFVVAAIASIAAGLVYAVLTRDQPNFAAAKICALLSAIGFGSLGITWGSSNMNYPLSFRMAAAFVVAGVAAAALTWVISDINGQNQKVEDGGIKILLAGDGPLSTVAPAGVNRRRTVRVKIENNTNNPISNGTLRALNLDPPYRDQTEFLLKSDLTVAAHGHIYADVAYFDEGSSQGLRGKFFYLVLPSPPAFAEAIPTFSIEKPVTFHLRFSTLEDGLFDEAYCRLLVGDDHVLRIENANSSTNRNDIFLHEAAVRLYEAAEEHGFLDFLVNVDDSPDKRLESVKHQLIVDDRINLLGIRPPSTKSHVISRADELTYEMLPGAGNTVVNTHTNDVIWHDVSLPIRDLNVVIADFIEHVRRLGQQ